jgi:DNA ligase (NAD+)
VTDVRSGDEQVIEPPETCPFCGEPVVQVPGEVGIYCDNPRCPEQLIRRVEYFVSRGAMDIDGFGAQTGALLVEEGLLKDIGDIYYLEPEPLLALEGFGEKKVENLLAGIEASKEQPAERFLTALGIRYVGSIVAGQLLDEFRSIDALSEADEEALVAIDGIGPQIARSVETWFDDQRHQQLLEKFRAAGLNFALPERDEEEAVPRPFEGLTFVITGTLPTMTRGEAKTYITDRGGRVTGSVSGNTDYLLAGEKAGSKLTRAEDLGVPVLDEAAVRRMAGEEAA